ncbi:MAG: beta-ketoacyl-[acyl-carrier-protein] synthase family protein [Candidatus Eisenbacteria bacterium]|uniref:Beta-ketoacyl-[acyl-carrier-protein] synthase family protein n=1 Tax=Eiseniibacteriota bacterium TaxID=2212470 RepID=A0A7Y2EBX7_UNCEI|nr:beta-ketoacyl-[acyl-carrier-protein] synthase family protein [Candidatus Eisenbacteria bacterium]
MPNNGVVITGVGPVSAIGCSRNEFWDALTAGTAGFGPITLCDASDSPSKIAAEVKDFQLSKYVAKGHVMARHTPRPVQLALAAGVLALHDSELDLDQVNADRLGVYVGTSLGNFGDILELNRKYMEKGTLPPHAAFHAFNHSAACVLSSFFNVRGPIHTVTSGCNSGMDALGQATRMIQSGTADAILVVGTDCEIVPEIMAALNASNSLTTKYNEEPHRASRPFELNRDGNVIGEGAAGLMLESEEYARKRGARIYAKVAGYQVCSAGQNRQYSHDSPDIDVRPCVRALRGAMSEAGWGLDEVDLINANGSSSVIYDRLEARALQEAFGEQIEEIPIHSTKSMLGQHGAGASALQAVATALTLRRGTAPPTINYEEPDPECGPLNVLTEAKTYFPANVLIHSIGLGGFYYSATALAAPDDRTDMLSGRMKVRWSDEQHPMFQPSAEFQKPLDPWEPRQDES